MKTTPLIASTLLASLSFLPLVGARESEVGAIRNPTLSEEAAWWRQSRPLIDSYRPADGMRIRVWAVDYIGSQLIGVHAMEEAKVVYQVFLHVGPNVEIHIEDSALSTAIVTSAGEVIAAIPKKPNQ